MPVTLQRARPAVVDHELAVDERSEADVAEVAVVGDGDLERRDAAMPVAARSTTGAPGSLLTMRIVAVSGVPGRRRRELDREVDLLARREDERRAGRRQHLKPVDPISRCTLVITRSAVPTLKICSVEVLRPAADRAEVRDRPRG